MLEELFKKAHERYSSLSILGGELEDLCQWLKSNGYPFDAIQRRVSASRRLEKILSDMGVASLSSCTSSQLKKCVAIPRTWTDHCATALARSLERFLSEGDRLKAPQKLPSGKALDEYACFLSSVRGLSKSTVRKHRHYIARFLDFIHYDRNPENLRNVGLDTTDAFVADSGKRLGRESMVALCAVLRSFLRFAANLGMVEMGLSDRIESPRIYRDERLPRAPSWDEVKRLLEGIDRASEKGRRDYAILLLIATYGVRRSEAASLELGDINWRAGEISIPRPKSGTPLMFPLTDDVGSAILAYLREDRPRSARRRVFLRVRAPEGPIGPDAVTDIFECWRSRLGIELPGKGGPHALRHALAIRLLGQGTCIKGIGDVLGHCSPESTDVYLRCNVEELRSAALPLPREGAAP